MILPEKIARELLIKDIRQLNEILETAHPDPYINGGGKVAYHRRLQKLIMAIPKEGMLYEDFYYHIQSFIASLEDAHTSLRQSEQIHNKENPGGIPLYFSPVEEILYVSEVVSKEHLDLIGSKLNSIEGISFSELIQRMKKLRGFDNISNLLGKLGRFGMLFFKEDLVKLLPEWNQDEKQIKVTLINLEGEEIEYLFKTSNQVQYPLHKNDSEISIPDAEKLMAYHFIDDKKNIAFLRIGDMVAFREAHELFREIGLTEFAKAMNLEYQKYNDGKLPEELDTLIAGLPSATQLFQSLFKEMKNYSSEYLLVDLRNCQGGQDFIIFFLLYFLVGTDRALELIHSRSDVLKLSNFLNDSTKGGIDLENTLYYDKVPLEITDYYFGNDKSFIDQQKDWQSIKKYYSKEFKRMPSFNQEYKTKDSESIYLPKKLVVLCSDITHSSGFDMMLNLKRLGAVNVGVASGQSGNHFGNIRQFELNNSKIVGKVATRFFIAFPDAPMKHLLHHPDFEITHKLLQEYSFDENTSLLYALKLIEEKKI